MSNVVYKCTKCGAIHHKPGHCPKDHIPLIATCPHCKQPIKECICN